MTESLAGKRLIVTGAGSGVGRATAVLLAREGVRVGLIARSREALEETAREVEAAGGEALAIPCDVTSEPEVNAATAAAVERFGGLDGLIAAAGIGRYGPVEDYSLADWEATLATNLTGVFLASRAVLPHLRASGGGWIVAIGSGAGKQGYATLAAYAASKFGLIGYMQSLGAEVGPHGIKTAVINPGSILTPFAGRSVPEKEAVLAADPGRKYLQPADVADAVRWLLHQPERAWTQEMNLWPF
jgi:NAD(P)-dependent dehydrogenase (short-subunit alcohol dehydrogenase family)